MICIDMRDYYVCVCVLCEFVLFWHLWTQPPNKKEVHAHAVVPPRTWGLGQIMTNHSLKQCGKSAPHLPP